MITQPITKQTVDVELSAPFSNQSVIPRKRKLMRIILCVRGSFRCSQRFRTSQKKKTPLIRHMTPSRFLFVVTPKLYAAPVQSEYALPHCGKYLINTTESGISK